MNYTFRPLGRWPKESAKNRRSRNTFSAPWSDTLYKLETELKYLKAENIVIQADFRDEDIRLDGMPRANARVPEHPGVIVSFESVHGPLQYLTDEHAFWQHNVRGIALGLAALRAVDRYGITKTGQQYTGWKALPAGGSGVTTQERAEQVIAQVVQMPLEEVRLVFTNDDELAGPRALYRKALRKAHPDGGGNVDLFSAIQDAGRILGLK